MYTDLLRVLQCPRCAGALRLEQPERDAHGDVLAGTLACSGCPAAYPIHHGIADFLGPPRPPNPTQWINDLPIAAWGYERLWRPYALTILSGEPFPYRRELPLIAGLAAPERGGFYVDLACSNGLYARALARAARGAPLTIAGVDHSLPMLQQAWQYAREAGLRISYVRARAQALPFRSASAAGVVVGGSLNEIGDLAATLSETRRALSADGRFVAMSLVRARTAVGRATQMAFGTGGIDFWAEDELVERFRRHGLRTTARWLYGVVAFTCSVPVS